MPSITLNVGSLIQSGAAVLLGLAVRKLWKKIDSIGALTTEVKNLTEAVKKAEGTVKGAIKKISILENEHHKLRDRVTRTESDVDWLKGEK